ncbi:ROK family protein [Cecembia rubra]|uniref:Glucokinase n=1 Tax=Cecembia rubra TaxID=1485585 RepID=A0A2P8E638_9BACT|nr:ROK family protein [Cecembia rubra]PSL04929.1 glucokinase [Cecembia rubra]
MTYKRIISGDIGGSHLTVALFEEYDKGFHLQKMERVSIDSRLGKSEILQNWFAGLKSLVNSFEGVYISMAMPAPFDYLEGVCLIQEQGKFLSLYGVNLKKEFSNELGIPEHHIKFINDAEAFLSGEVLFGKGKNIDALLGITLGSGLGSALKKGKEIRDASLWNFPFKDGIVEDYLGTKWFQMQARDKLGIEIIGVKELIETVGDTKVLRDIFSEFALNLGEFIIQQYHIHHFECIILSGNISKSSLFFQRKVKEYLYQAGLDLPIEISQLGENAALYGAAALFFDSNKGTRLILN